MVCYVSLIAYHTEGRQQTPAHWAILLTKTENEDVGNPYHIIESPPDHYRHEVKSQYDISTTEGRFTRTALGILHDSWWIHLNWYSRSMNMPSDDQDPFFPTERNRSQIWVMKLLNELVNWRALDESALDVAETCPRE